MPTTFQLVMRAGPTPGKTFLLEGAEIILGRDPTCTISINDAQVSRRHARLTLSSGGYILQDLGSTNGTFVNGQRVTGEHPLTVGELIALGENVVLVYEGGFDPNATMVATPSHKAKAVAAAAPPPAPAVAGPIPSYAGQVPAGPETAAEPKRKSKAWLIILIILVLVICACVGALFLIDQLRLWCTFFPFLFPNAC